MENKREVSVLIPYQIRPEGVLVFLQKRAADRKILPNHFAFFGGKLEEGENPTEALEREIKEELSFTPIGYTFLGKYNFLTATANVYFLLVDDTFEQKITVMEGDYGKFFSEEEVEKEPMIIGHDKVILKDLYKALNEKYGK